MQFKKKAAPKPERITTLLELDPLWWRKRDRLQRLSEEICLLRADIW